MAKHQEMPPQLLTGDMIRLCPGLQTGLYVGEIWATLCGLLTNGMLGVGGGTRANIREVTWDKNQVL